VKILGRTLLLLAGALAVLGASEGIYRGALFLDSRSTADAGSFALYAVGGSTTEGQPFNKRMSLPFMVSAMFSGRIEDRPIVVHNLARGGEPIYLQWRRLRRAVACRRGPGAVLIYAGVEPGGPQPDELCDPQSRLSRWWERRVCPRSFVLADLFYLARRVWPHRNCYSISTYDFYLRQTAALAREHGLTPVLSTVVANMASMEPNFEMDAETDPAEPRVAEGRRLEKAGRLREAIARYSAAASAAEPLRPYLLYRTAKCWQALGRYDQARECYWQAVEEDPKWRFWRPTRAQNDLVRRIATDTGALLADSAALFQRSSPHGLQGAELFMDFHHPDLRGYQLLAAGFSEALGPAVGQRPQGRDWSEDELRRRFGIDDDELFASWLRTGALLMECACSLYPWPEDRIALARRAYAAALTLRPKDRQALLGMALLSAPAARRLLRNREAMAWIIPSLWDDQRWDARLGSLSLLRPARRNE
jgi:tetratricopeptide (TPR) repeat protein